LQKVPFSVL